MEPLQLVTADGETLRVVEHNLLKLKSISVPLHVIAVVGPFHSGKSYLLNRLMGLKKDEGFKLGYTVNPTTKGIWCARYNKQANCPSNERTCGVSQFSRGVKPGALRVSAAAIVLRRGVVLRSCAACGAAQDADHPAGAPPGSAFFGHGGLRGVGHERGLRCKDLRPRRSVELALNLQLRAHRGHRRCGVPRAACPVRGGIIIDMLERINICAGAALPGEGLVHGGGTESGDGPRQPGRVPRPHVGGGELLPGAQIYPKPY
eukprot:809861-Prorocentrum_minimum.AAC.2